MAPSRPASGKSRVVKGARKTARTSPASNPPPAAASASASNALPALTAAQTRFLRGQAHGLKAMLQVGGKGLSDAVVAEIDAALEHHELIKIKIGAEDRESRDAMVGDLVARSRSALVQRIGHVAILYRPSRDRRQIVLPRA